MQGLYKDRGQFKATRRKEKRWDKNNLNLNFLGNIFFVKHLKIDLPITKIKLQIAKLDQFHIPVNDYTTLTGFALKLRVTVSYIIAKATKWSKYCR